MSRRSRRNAAKKLRVREEAVSDKESNKPGTSVIVQQPPQTPNIDVMAYRLEQNELATRELKAEMSEGFKSIKNQITEFTNNFATQAQVSEIETELRAEIKKVELGAAKAIKTVSNGVEDLKTERLNLLKQIAKWTVIGLVMMVLGIYGINQFF